MSKVEIQLYSFIVKGRASWFYRFLVLQDKANKLHNLCILINFPFMSVKCKLRGHFTHETKRP